MSGTAFALAEITWEQFEAVDMRVGRVVGVEEFPEARVPAWKLEIDFGPEIGRKRSSAQITHYAREDLEGRLVVAVVNFPPKRIGPFPLRGPRHGRARRRQGSGAASSRTMTSPPVTGSHDRLAHSRLIQTGVAEYPLTIVSNRGPAEFGRDETGQRIVHRGGGGLVTALSGLVSHRKALWIASAMTEEDVVVANESEGPVEIEVDGIDYDVQMVASNPSAYDRFYNVIANPILWFIQHYLWDLSNAPDIRQAEVDAWEEGYKVVNDDIADCVIRAIEGQEDPVVMLHDYHLYTCPG